MGVKVTNELETEQKPIKQKNARIWIVLIRKDDNRLWRC